MKEEVQSHIDVVKELLKDENTDPERLVSATSELQTSLQKIGEAMYAADQASAAAGAPGEAGDAEGEDGKNGEDGEDGEETVEGEFREV